MVSCASSFLLCLIHSQFLYLCAASSAQKPVLLALTHTLSSPPSPSQFHLLKSASLRSAARFNARRGRELPLPLAAGADYTLSLSISSRTVSLYLDTGSDLVWFPCSPFQCILCENKPFFSTPHGPPPSSSRPLPCSSPLCSSAHSSLPIADLCAAALCPLDDIETSSCSPSSHPCPLLYYAYGDGSLLASLRTGPLSVPSLPNLTFACAHSALAEPLGVAGFGRGPLSLPSQLAELSPSLSSRFSYCLQPHSFLSRPKLRPSPLILGRSTADSFVYTPLLRSADFFYSISLLSISVGRVRVPASAGLDSRGLAVDSGTTFTMLPGEMHGRLTAEFRRQMEGRGFIQAVRAEDQTGLGPCYAYGGKRKVPAVVLHFAGNASVRLPARNYFMGFESDGERVGCLMMMSGGDEPLGMLGNFQQQGMEVLFDSGLGRIGFARRRCAALWDSLSRG